MSNIQQGIRFHMPVKITGVDLADVDKIEFLFKLAASTEAAEVKSAVWLPDGTGSAVTGTLDGETVIQIPWTRADTFRFPAGCRFYLHARIHYTNTEDEPYVPILELRMGPSLFGEADVDEEAGA